MTALKRFERAAAALTERHRVLTLLVRLSEYCIRALLTPIRARRCRLYLGTHAVRKLQIGAGSNFLAGWLNTDLLSWGLRYWLGDGVYIDAGKTFPFDDGTFDYVFGEHLIEHMSYRKGLHMLRECRRVLKPGGVCVLPPPTLPSILSLYGNDPDATRRRYLQRAIDLCLPDIEEGNPCFVINNFFRSWGHQFIYDAETLEHAVLDAGLVDPHRYCPARVTIPS